MRKISVVGILAAMALLPQSAAAQFGAAATLDQFNDADQKTVARNWAHAEAARTGTGEEILVQRWLKAREASMPRSPFITRMQGKATSESVAREAQSNSRKRELSQAVLRSSREGTDAWPPAAKRMRSEGDDERKKIPLPKSYPGVMVYYPSKSRGIEHGHILIYSGARQIVEAANAKVNVIKQRIRKKKVPKGESYFGMVIQKLDGKSGKRSRAAARFAKNQVGKKYRTWYDVLFSAGKNKYHSAPWNCSQLVWEAWGRQGYWLDQNGQRLVLPIDGMLDPKVDVYASI